MKREGRESGKEEEAVQETQVKVSKELQGQCDQGFPGGSGKDTDTICLPMEDMDLISGREDPLEERNGNRDANISLPGTSLIKNPPANAKDSGSMPGLGKYWRRSKPLQYSYL